MKRLINVLIFVLFFLIGLFLFSRRNNKYVKNSPLPKTEIEIENKKIDIGVLEKDSVWNGHINVKNIGKWPLLIYDVTTTCGCVQVDYLKKPVACDSVDVISLRVVSNQIGHFDKRIRIFCNAANSPLVCSISGDISD